LEIVNPVFYRHCGRIRNPLPNPDKPHFEQFAKKTLRINFLTRILRIMLIHADKNKKKIRVNPPNPPNPRSIFNSDGFFA